MVLLGQMVAPHLTSEELPNCFPKWLHHFTFIPATYESSNFPTSLPTLGIFCHFYSSNPTGHGEVSYYSFICFPSTTNDGDPLFMCLLSICISSIEKYVLNLYPVLN